MQRKETKADDRRTRYTRGVIRETFMDILKNKPFSKITVTELCRLAEINRSTFYIHYYDVNDVLDDILDISFADVSETIDHVLCLHKETCTYPFCQKVQENKAIQPLFMDDTIVERITNRVAENGKERFVCYLMQHSKLTYEQAESIFYFQIHGCLAINRIMLKNNCRDWHNVQQTVDSFIRTGLNAFIDENSVGE